LKNFQTSNLRYLAFTRSSLFLEEKIG